MCEFILQSIHNSLHCMHMINVHSIEWKRSCRFPWSISICVRGIIISKSNFCWTLRVYRKAKLICKCMCDAIVNKLINEMLNGKKRWASESKKEPKNVCCAGIRTDSVRVVSDNLLHLVLCVVLNTNDVHSCSTHHCMIRQTSRAGGWNHLLILHNNNKQTSTRHDTWGVKNRRSSRRDGVQAVSCRVCVCCVTLSEWMVTSAYVPPLGPLVRYSGLTTIVWCGSISDTKYFVFEGRMRRSGVHVICNADRWV